MNKRLRNGINRVSGVVRLALEMCCLGMLCLIMLGQTGCRQRETVTMDLAEVSLKEGGSAILTSIEEYQSIRVEQYTYPSLGKWINSNRTSGISRTEEGVILVFTRGEDGFFEWRQVKYEYPFYDAYPLGSQDSRIPLVIDPVELSADGEAVAFQSLQLEGQFIEISQMGLPSVLLDGNGNVWREGAEISISEGEKWNSLLYDWTSDGQMLLYYQMGNYVSRLDEEEEAEAGETFVGLEGSKEEIPIQVDPDVEEPETEAGTLLLPYGIYAYDRGTGETQMIWEPMRLNLPVNASGISEPGQLLADAAEDRAVVFILFDEDAGCPDIQLYRYGDRVEIRLLNLPDDPDIQFDMDNHVYYYQKEGEIWKAPFGKTGQAEPVVVTEPGLQDFLVSEDGQRVFTIEKREDTADVCLYLRDEKQNWYKQVIYMDAIGAAALQLSEDQKSLLVECAGEMENQAVIIQFHAESLSEADGSDEG